MRPEQDKGAAGAQAVDGCLWDHREQGRGGKSVNIGAFKVSESEPRSGGMPSLGMTTALSGLGEKRRLSLQA